MRVYFKREDGRARVIEVIQMILYDNDTLGLVMANSQYAENRGFNYYQSTRKVEEREFKNWSEQLLRSGYLDLSGSDIFFKAMKS